MSIDPNLTARTDAEAVRATGSTALVLGARLVSKGVAFLVVVVMWNHLHAAGFGLFNTLVTLSSLVALAADLGMPALMTREVARRPGELARYLSAAATAKAGLAVLALVILAAGLAVTVPDGFNYLPPLFALLAVSSYANLLRSAFYARGRLGFESLAIMGESVILLVMVAIGTGAQMGIAWFLWMYVASYAFTVVFALWVITRRLDARPSRPEVSLIPHLLRGGLPFALATALSTLYFKVDVLLLVWFGYGFQMVGWYSAGYKYIEALIFIPVTMTAVLFPILSAMHGRSSRESSPELDQAYRQSFRILGLIGLPFAIGALMVPDQVVALSRGFPESSAALQVLALALLPLFVNNAFIVGLTAIDRQWEFTLLAGLSLVLNVAANAVLIPGLHGYLGAAWATVLTELGLFLGGWLAMRRHGHQLPFLPILLRSAPAGIAMALSFALTRSLPVMLAIVLATAVYLAALVISRAVGREELAVARAALSRARGTAR